MIFVRPAEGLKVRHPQKLNFHLPKDGYWMSDSNELQRLILDGDVIIDKTKVHPDDAATTSKKDGGTTK